MRLSLTLTRSMADVTYNTSSFPSLIRTLESLLRPVKDGIHKSPMVVLGYKERDSAERTLWDMAAGIHLDLERIGERVGADEPPVEIWAARPKHGL